MISHRSDGKYSEKNDKGGLVQAPFVVVMRSITPLNHPLMTT